MSSQSSQSTAFVTLRGTGLPEGLMTRFLTSFDELRDKVPDGSLVAIGGAGLARKPMAALRALIAAGARDLDIVSFLGSVDVELLLAGQAVSTLHTAGVSLDGFGLAPLYRAARQEGSVEFIEWSEGSLCAALEAAARSLPSYPSSISVASPLVELNPWLGAYPDPPTGIETVFARALQPDVALLHAAAADHRGNVYVEGDFGIDGLLARAAGVTVVSVGEIGSDADPSRAALSRVWVDAIVEAPGGSWPTECHPAAFVDLDAVSGWARSGGSDVDLLRARP